MNRKAYMILALALIFLAFGFLTGCSSSSAPPPPPTILIVPISGDATQSTPVGTQFTNPLGVTVTSNGSPDSSATVTYAATTSSGGATCALSATTATTNSSGQVTSVTCTANATAGSYTVTASVSGASTPATFNLTNGPAPVIAATSGSPQTTTIGQPFPNALVATVTSNGSPASGMTVTFAAGTSSGGATCALSATTAITGSNGQASVTCTANGTPGSYAVTATTTGSNTASFNLTNAPIFLTFYASGLEDINETAPGVPNYYAIAGAIAIDLTYTPVADQNGNCGEQDYNDGMGGVTKHDMISAKGSGFSSSLLSTGQGTLTLVTTDTSIGSPSTPGTEVFAMQAVNGAHALISQFDGSATSSGSIDLQTNVPVSGNFAFTLSGQDSGYQPVGYGGVFTATSGTPTTISGTVDVNDDGTLTPGTAGNLTGTIYGADGYGYGTATVTDSTIPTTLLLAYYIVGPEAIRIIDVDPGQVTASGGPAVGSAYGQGTTGGVANTFTNASLGNSVFGLLGDPWGYLYAAAGSFATTPAAAPNTTSGAFSGTSDQDEEYKPSTGSIGGNYTIETNGYGNVSVTTGLGNTGSLGLYMTDPNLNLLDPNNTTGGGGALLLDLDALLSGGTGIVIPQTDFAQSDFTGSYAVGAQDLNTASALTTTGFGEFDFVGEATVASLALTGTAEVSDPFAFFNPGPPAVAGLYTGATLTGTATPDPNEATNGRYYLLESATPPDPLVLTPSSTVAPYDFSVVAIYQANGNQLFWIDADDTSLWFGTLEQQSLAPAKAAFGKWKPAAKAQPKQKR